MAQYDGITVTYENNRGNKVVLTDFPYYLNVENLFDYAWSYAMKEKGRGSIIAGFSKAVESKDLVLHVIGNTMDERNQAIDDFNDVVDADIYDGTPGKIWFNNWFSYGYIIEAKDEKWQYGVSVIKKTIKLVREKDSWYRITSRNTFENPDIVIPWEDGVKDYEDKVVEEQVVGTGYDYAYDYFTDIESTIFVNNPNPIGANWEISIMGPVNSPQVKIGNAVVHIDVNVPDGAVLVVSTTQKTAIMTLADGTEINVFGARDPDHYLFALIDSGVQSVQWNNVFMWELKMFEERSEPRWHTDLI